MELFVSQTTYVSSLYLLLYAKETFQRFLFSYFAFFFLAVKYMTKAIGILTCVKSELRPNVMEMMRSFFTITHLLELHDESNGSTLSYSFFLCGSVPNVHWPGTGRGLRTSALH